jgi:hypothetical protein
MMDTFDFNIGMLKDIVTLQKKTGSQFETNRTAWMEGILAMKMLFGIYKERAKVQVKTKEHRDALFGVCMAFGISY